MKKLYIAFVVVFAVMLLLPFSAQTIADLRGEKRFVSLDIFKDVVYTPFKRESKMAESAAKLNEAGLLPANPWLGVAKWAKPWSR